MNKDYSKKAELVQLNKLANPVGKQDITQSSEKYVILPINQAIRDVPSKYKQHVSQKIGSYVRRENEAQIIDYRTPLFAVPNTEKETKIIPNTRVTGSPGLKPLPRPEVANQLLAALRVDYMHTKPRNAKDYLEGEENFIKYADSARSRRLPYSEMRDKIKSYFTTATAPLNDELQDAFEQAIAIVRDRIHAVIKPKSLRLLSPESAAEQIPPTTMGGTPFMVTGKVTSTDPDTGKVTVEEDNRPLYVNIVKDQIKGINRPQLDYPFLAIGRGQEAKKTSLLKFNGIEYNKQRKPGAEAHNWSIIGAMTKPFMDARAKFPTRAALINQAKVDEVIHDAFGSLVLGERILSWDGSAYDEHMIPQVAISIAHEIIIPTFNYSGPEMEDLVQRYFTHMFYSPLITAEGIGLGGHGMPSGTTYTNELDSIYNEVLVEAFNILAANRNLSVRLQMVTEQGDDAVMKVKSPYTDEKVLDIVEKIYAIMRQEVNANKQMISTRKCEFLKRLHVSDVKPSYRSYIGSLIGMMNMERPKDGKPAMHTARGIMQAANHYEELPGFDTFMRFIVNGDSKYHLGLTEVSKPEDIFVLAGGVKKAIDRLGLKAYATHLGVTHGGKKDATVELTSLSSIRGLNKQKK